MAANSRIDSRIVLYQKWRDEQVRKELKKIANNWRLFAIILAVSLSACDGYTRNEGDLSEPVRYILGGKKYEVPLGYHYTDYLKRKMRWPNPKDEFSEAGAISITGLTPGFTPYDESTKGEFEQPGTGNKIHLIISPNVTVYPVDEYLRRMSGSGHLQSLESDLPGLKRYWDNYGGADETKGADVYVKDGDSEYFMLRCERIKAPSPSCGVTKVRSDGLQISYTFSSAHLAEWADIDRDVNQRIEGFKSRK